MSKDNIYKDSSQQLEKWLERQPKNSVEIEISVVIPAYNEARRLPPTLIDMLDYFDQLGRVYEIIVVDDGSHDSTALVVQKFEKIKNQIRLIRMPKNTGKGHAVRTGFLNAHGKIILLADADGATPISEFARLEAAINSGIEIAIGSRAIRSQDTKVKTRWYRKYLGRIFNNCVNLFLLPGIADTQCGFKLFKRGPAQFVFQKQTSERFSFDIEILFIARQVGLKISEVAINWTNVPGSKVNLILDSLDMLKDIFLFRLRHSQLTQNELLEFYNKK